MRIVPAGLLAQLAERRELGLDLLEARADRLQQALARLGRRDAARGAGQQPKRRAAPPGRGWCGSAPIARRRAWRRGLGEAALLRHREEGEQGR